MAPRLNRDREITGWFVLDNLRAVLLQKVVKRSWVAIPLGRKKGKCLAGTVERTGGGVQKC